MMKNSIISLVVVLMFSACGGFDKDSSSKRVSNSDTNTTQPPLVIDGYTLPPMPDKTLNDSTLLGIDSNDNGVRDDVEIWIYKKYEGKHQIVKEIAMQTGRAFQVVLENPENAKETHKVLNAAQYCGYYFQYDAEDNNESISFKENAINEEFKEVQLNTKSRVHSYMQYNHLLSGGVYTLPYNERKYCDFNITNFLEK